MAIVPVGTGGHSLFNFTGATDVVVDVLGWFPAGAGFAGLTPARLLDTRVVPPPPPPPPPTIVTLRPGTLIVGTNVAPGRYVANARDGCYWERLRGFSGTSSDRITNFFQSFNGRAIVDILPTDVGFWFDADCGTFQTYVPPDAPSATITPGAHVVGAHVNAGTYVTNAAPGCYWERLRGFNGSSSDRITNGFVGDGGQVIVTILPTDTGFFADDQCGTWSRL
jgi:hypothetical protein